MSVTTKRCTRCYLFKPFTAFAKRHDTKDGHQPSCRTCHVLMRKQYKEQWKLKPIKRVVPKEKHCADCGIIKPASEFYRNPRSRDGLAGYCAVCQLHRIKINTRCRAKSEPVLPADGMKACKECKKRKPLKDFNVSRAYSDHRCATCRVCYRTIQWTQVLKQRYGLTPKQYQQMYDRQGGKCAVCRMEETHTRHGQVIKLCVDHNHDTGAIRNLLCSRCNRAIGLLKDDPIVAEAMLQYLRKHSRPQ